MSEVRRPKHPWRRALERLAARCVAATFSAIVRPLPLSWIRRMGNAGGLLVYAISARRQRLAEERTGS